MNLFTLALRCLVLGRQSTCLVRLSLRDIQSKGENGSGLLLNISVMDLMAEMCIYT